MTNYEDQGPTTSHGVVAAKVASESLAETDTDPWSGPDGQRSRAQQTRAARHDYRRNGGESGVRGTGRFGSSD